MQSRFLRSATWSFSLSMILVALPALSAEEKTLEDLLIQKGVITEEERAEIQPAEAANSSDLPDVASAAAEKEEADDKPKVVAIADHKGIRFETTDGRFKFGFGGRIQVDAAGYKEGVSPLGAGIELRRGRIKAYGTVFTDWDYKLEVNFDPDLDVPMTDAWLRYSRFKPFTITAGHQKVPFSQQSMTSSNWQVFQERALLDAFIDTTENGRRRLGGVLGAYGENWGVHWNANWGMFGEGLNFAKDQNEEWGTASRVVVAPLAEKTRVLAFGASVYYRNFLGPNDTRYASRPESHIAGTKMVDTGSLPNTNDQLLWNVEGSMVWGPFHAQGEYTQARLERSFNFAMPAGNFSNVTFSGWYVQGGFFITGESRNYDPKSGKYKRIMPTRKYWGAWEIAARYSKLDLQDRDVLGGREGDVTVALNWWANAMVMLRFNYVYADLSPNSAETLQGVPEQAHVFSGRAQIVF